MAWACTSPTVTYDSSLALSEEQQKEMLYSIIRYLGHLPKKATHTSKFDEQYDEEYKNIASAYTLDLYYQHPKSNEVFILASRQAPSLKYKRVATGIRMVFDSDNALTTYEEVFRTWKMEPEELEQKASFLFDRMVKGKDLSPYYSENSGKEEYIEFPSDYAYFDVELRRWISSRENPVEEIKAATNAARQGS